MSGHVKTPLVTKQEAADSLRVSVRTVWRLIAAGKLASVMVGKQRMIVKRERAVRQPRQPDALDRLFDEGMATPDPYTGRAMTDGQLWEWLRDRVNFDMALNPHAQIVNKGDRIILLAANGNPPRRMSRGSVASVKSRKPKCATNAACEAAIQKKDKKDSHVPSIGWNLSDAEKRQ
jgi:excisionase family DNA binding protein